MKKLFTKQNAEIFLMLLLVGDLSFIILHLVIGLTPVSNKRIFSLSMDFGYPERFQYLKWLGIISLFIFVAIVRHSSRYLAMGLVFLYILLDDAKQIHERLGGFISGYLNFRPPFGLRIKDIGELTVTAFVGIIFLAIFICIYSNGDKRFKKVSKDILLLIFALAFFGVGVDMLHSAVKGGGMVFILRVVEEGGEMMVASFILWYVFLLSQRDEG